MLAGGLVLLGCESRDSGARPGELSDRHLAQMVDQRVQEILDHSNRLTREQTLQLASGETVEWRERRPRHLVFPVGKYDPNPAMFAETPGEVLATFAPARVPNAMLVDDAGRVLVAGSWGVEVHQSGTEPWILSEARASVLQWGPDGREVLLSGPSRKAIHVWPAGGVLHELDAQRVNGFLQYAPTGEGLWLLRDTVDLSAGSSTRVLWEVLSLTKRGTEIRRLTSEPLEVSALGTLPLAGKAWAHAAQPYRIFPDPGPLHELTAGLALSRAITLTEDEVDMRPSVDRTGRLYFVRMSRVIESPAGAMINATARAWTQPLAAPQEARLLTAEPTLDVAVSPGGGRVAVLVARAGQAVLVLAESEALLARDLSEQAEAQERFRRAMQSAAADVRAAFAATPMGASMEQTPFGPEPSIPPTNELMEAMGGALREAVAMRLGVTLAEDFAALGTIDRMMNAGDGYWEEEPAMVAALAAVYGDTLATLPEVEWHLDLARAEMSSSLTTATLQGDGMYFTLHSPFAAARERLAGRLELDATARGALERSDPPMLLVENFQPETIEAYLVREALLAGISADGAEMESYEDAVLRMPDNDVANLVTLAVAREQGERAIAALAALNLARANPCSGDALLKAAQAVHDLGLAEPALRLYRQAELLAPRDPQVLYGTAIGYFDEGMLEEAAARFRRAAEFDANNEFRFVIEENLRQIEMMLEEEFAAEGRR